MSKVFRLYNIQGNNNIVDWQDSKVYGSQAIGEIADPEGADAKKEITSIPSPFARIDLVKTAFKEVVDMANKRPNDKEYRDFDGNNNAGKKEATIFHKMVSDALDVAELFFNFDTFKDKFEILVWDRHKDLNPNSIFGKTLSRYLESDATGDNPYNFNQLDRIYMLNYIGPDRPASLNIVGATSPATLFFSSANDLSYVSQNISFGRDKPFDDEYQPLYKRDFEFQKYLYTFRKAYGKHFHKDFPEFDDYLISQTGKICNYKHLSQKQKDEIDALTENSLSMYASIAVGSNGADTLDILGRPFHKKPSVINWKSDFEIKSDLYTDSRKPLVLPVEAGNTYANLNYTTDKWGKDCKAPYSEKTPWINRRLPYVSTEYPYLTISDFLADTIVRMPYKLNDESFYNGNYKSEEESFLLPLTNTFFRFFTVKELQGTVEGNRKMFELVANAGGIKAILRIPIQKGYIEYSRTYFETNRPDIEHNDGALFEKRFGLGILPLVTFPDNVKKHYRIALFDKKEKDINLTCCKGSDSFKEEAHIVREKKNSDLNRCSFETYVITDNFDRIKVQVGEITGIIVPKFKATGSNKKIFTFAVDFGTTNSHIEYSFVTSESAQNSVVKAFDIPLSEKQLHQLHDSKNEYGSDPDIYTAFCHNFIPDTITDIDDYSFPMRTAFSEWNNNDRTKNLYAMANGNIPFLYEKDIIPGYNEVRTELKWRGEDDYPLIKLYLENIFLLLRNKVVLNSGNLEATKIIWFYPASMDTSRCDDFNEIWQKLYKEYFGSNVDANLITISESAAPYRYYRKKKGAKSEVVTIDVGGGTTDVYIVENDKPKMLLSFLFASNSIFGDGFNWDSDSNGFVNLYYEPFTEILNNCGHPQLVETLKQIEERKHSPDIVTFFFSLFANKKINSNEALNFMLKLSQNKKLKYVFILFYGAILYFIAKSMKTNLLKRPLTLAFSGNGSKTLRILSSNNTTISEYAKLIFDGVYGNDGNRIDIIFEDEPKKATSKGGVLTPTRQTPKDIKEIKFTLIGDNLDSAPIDKVKFEEVTEDMQEKIVDSVIAFVDFLFELHDDNDEFLTRSLGADDNIIDEVKEICKDRVELSQSLKSALNTKKGSKVIEETLFFYPLINVLHELALKVSKM
jgi:hypothetical protein